MECVIPKRSLKIFAKVIQCLSKVGEELFLEPSADKLVLRTLNQARSAFVAITFQPGFFEAYNFSADAVAKCKLQLKSCLAVFRAVASVEKCTMRLDEAESRLVVDLLCKMGVKKTYKLVFEECEALQAIYSKENCPNKIVSRPRLLIDIVNNFHNNLDEISFVVTDKTFKVKSYIDDEKKSSPTRVLHTELTVDPKDFEEFVVTTAAGDITFCLKEFKALLQFCEAAGQAISIWFEQGGRPILFSVNFFNAFEVDFVLATLLDGGASSSQSSTSESSSQTPSNSARHVKQGYSAPGTPSSTPSSSMGDSIMGSSQLSRGSQTPPSSQGASPMSASSSSVYARNRNLADSDHSNIPDTGPTSITSSMVDAIGTDKRQRSASKMRSSEGEEEEEEEEEEYVEGTPPSSPPLKRTRDL